MNLILIGPQGCGKGTQAQQLADKYHLFHVEVGQLIRAQTQHHSQKSQIIDHLTNKKGELLPDGIVFDIIHEPLARTNYQQLLFDGFPRTQQQYTALKELLTSHHQKLNAALYLEISDQEAIRRLSSRRICAACGHNYSLLLEPQRSLCDCSGKLINRPDDYPEAIQFRLNTYHYATKPVLDLLKQDHLLITINGHQPIPAIFQAICLELDKRQHKFKTTNTKSVYLAYPTQITKLTARQIIDSRGWPTIECACHLSNGQTAIAAVPSGVSTGSHEALELRDNNPADYLGKSVHTAIGHINHILSLIASSHNPDELFMLDQLFINADGTANKSNLGANAILAASLAISRAGALAAGKPLYRHLQDLCSLHQLHLPTPIFNLLNGGIHSGTHLDFQEYMILPHPDKIPHYPDQLAACIAIFHQLGNLLQDQGQSISIGDQGGFTPNLNSPRLAIDLLATATSSVNLRFSQQILLGLDLAANNFCNQGRYQLHELVAPLTSEQYLNLLQSIINDYHPYIFEDPFSEDDWPNWADFTRSFGSRLLVAGDDLLVTHKDRLQQAIDAQACNAIVVKLNQIGTVSETIEVIKLAQAAGYKTIISHRSGETNDDFIADFAVGVGADLVKFGAPDRGECVGKYNRLLQINSDLYPDKS